jgi:hypothetical protein
MSKGCLFIGGVKDGQRIRIEHDRDYVTFPVILSDPRFLRIDEIPSATVNYRLEEYHTMDLCGDNERFVVYVLKDMTGSDVMKALIENYRPNLEERES